MPSSDIDGVPGASPLHISVTSHLPRCGKQAKLVLRRESADQSEPNPKLVAMVVNARRWFASLLAGECASIAQVAERAGLDRTYISRVITLAFLAPGIVEAILFGSHDASLTPERLRKACPLPVRWEDQRALLFV